MEIVNVEQAAAWDGNEGDHWTEYAERYEHGGWRHWQRLVDSGAIQPTDRVLDVGCGTGRSTRDAARIATEGSALGLDLSARMLAHARARAEAEGLDNVAFEQGDAQVHSFDEGAYDVAISSYGVMFFNDPVAAFTNIGRALVPGGRLALLVWGEFEKNAWINSIRDALAMGRELPVPPPEAPTPFSLAQPERVRRILGEAGFEAIDLTEVAEPLEFGTDADDAWTFIPRIGIVQGLSHDLSEADRATALENLRAVIDAAETPDGVLLDTTSWLITARRA